MKPKDRFLSLNLQFFAEVDEGDVDESTGGEGDEEKETIELTQEELKKQIESESDRKLASALQKKQREWDSQLQDKINEALKEQKRLSKLSEKERQEEQLTQREKEIAEREAEIARKELKADAIADLNDKGLPSDFADFLLGEDAESTLENINAFKAMFDGAVNAAVKEKLRQKTPRSSVISKNGSVMSVAELANESRVIK